MVVFWHATTFIFSGVLIWLLAGILIESTERIARGLNRSSFSVAFLLLGLVTSLSEMSVALNAALLNVPQASAGNLVGASVVIFMGIIPLLAVFGNGVSLAHSFRSKELLTALLVIALPALLALDGRFSATEGWLMIVFYVLLVYLVQTKTGLRATQHVVKELHESQKIRQGGYEVGKIILGGTIIFFASRLLVEQAVYFAGFFGVSTSLIGILLLSLGTNIPELVVAVRAIMRRYKQVAFGDYVGSAAANTLILGVLIVGNGSFAVMRNVFIPAFILMALGLTLFYILARSGSRISRGEGMVLGSLYLLFIVVQIVATGW